MSTPTVIAERFELIRLAGRGGMGTVYQANDRVTGESVALKRVRIPSPEIAGRFEQEARLLAEVRHPSIVRYIDHGTTEEGDLYLAMEWLKGEDLQVRLRRERLGLASAVQLVTRVAEALAAMHRLGVVHRDIKPSNLFLVDGDPTTPKLLDFGIALVERQAMERFTAQGAVPGTPGYMAPEQFQSRALVDARADVYGLGCVLFKCIAGRTPFTADDPMALMMKVVLDTPPRLEELCPDVPYELAQLVDRMILKEPEERFADGAALATALRSLPPIAPSEVGRLSQPMLELTELERRLVSVVLAARALPEPELASNPELQEPGEDVTRAGTKASPHWLAQRVCRVVEEHGGRVGTLLDGSVVVMLTATGSATDLVQRAARCALAIHQLTPEAPLAVATAHVVPSARLLDEAADRAAELLRTLPPGAPGVSRVRVDEITAGLLGASFDVAGDENGLWLRGVSDAGLGAHRVLGRETSCVGRTRELAMFEATWRECADESVSSWLLLTGAAGMGKSRVVQELLRRLRERGEAFELLHARGDEISAGSPFGMLASLIRNVAQLAEDEPLDVSVRKLRARVGRHLPAEELDRVVGFVAELVGATSGGTSEGPQVEAARNDPMLMGDQIRRAFEDFIEAETSAGPVLMVLDDLQWGDLPSIRTVQNVLRRLSDRPLVVIAIARPEIKHTFPSLKQGPPITELQLGPLSRKASEALAREVLGGNASDADVSAAAERAGGHAIYLEEILRAHREGRRGSDTVLLMVQARLEELEGEARRILRAASVFGEVFWAGGVRQLLGGAERTTLLKNWLSELLDRELIVQRPRSRFQKEREFEFTSTLVRDAAYGMLTDADRTLGHRLAAAWLDLAGEKDVLCLAEHHERGGDPPAAVRFWLAGATQALEGNDFVAAIERAERGARTGGSDRELGELRLVQARAHRWAGASSEAERCGREAMKRFDTASAGFFDAAAEVAQAVGRQGGRVEALVTLAEIIERVKPRPDAQRSRQIAAARIAVHLAHADRLDVAERLVRDVAEKARQPTARAFASVARGSLALSRGDPSLGLACSKDAVASFESVGALRDACMQRVNIGFAFMEVGDYEAAERELRTAIATAERMGLDDARAIAKQNLAMTLALRDQLDEAGAQAHASIEAFGRQGNRLMLGNSMLYLAFILIERGELEAAVQKAREAVDTLHDFGVRGHALAVLARALRRRGETGAALEAARAAMAVVDELGSVEEGDGRIFLELAEALHASDQPEEARATIESAQARLLERAEKISDGEKRADFLTRIPDHARILILAEEGFDER